MKNISKVIRTADRVKPNGGKSKMGIRKSLICQAVSAEAFLDSAATGSEQCQVTIYNVKTAKILSLKLSSLG